MLEIAMGIATLIVGLIAGFLPDDEKLAAFTQGMRDKMLESFPDYNVVIIHTQHTVSGSYQSQQLVFSEPDWFIETGFYMYMSPITKTFTLDNQGDGGYINWAWGGYFTQNGGQITSVPQWPLVNCITLYTDSNFGGLLRNLPVGQYAYLGDAINDQVSSLMTRTYRAVSGSRSSPARAASRSFCRALPLTLEFTTTDR